MYIAFDHEPDNLTGHTIIAMIYENEDSWNFSEVFTTSSEEEFVDFIAERKPTYLIAWEQSFSDFQYETFMHLKELTEIKHYTDED